MKHKTLIIIGISFLVATSQAIANPTDLVSVQKAKLDLLNSIADATQSKYNSGTATFSDVISAKYEAALYRASISVVPGEVKAALLDAVQVAEKGVAFFESQIKAGVGDRALVDAWTLRKLTALEKLYQTKL